MHPHTLQDASVAKLLLSEFEQSNKLREVVMQVIYDQSGNQIVIKLRDDLFTIFGLHG